MKLDREKRIEEIVRNKYIVTVYTMEGDADDYHSFDNHFPASKLEELKEFIIYCEVLKRQYPNGRGGGDDYDFTFFDLHFSEEWNYSEYCDSYDSMEGYKVIFFDATGVSYDVIVKLDEEDYMEIKSYGVLKH